MSTQETTTAAKTSRTSSRKTQARKSTGKTATPTKRPAKTPPTNAAKVIKRQATKNPARQGTKTAIVLDLLRRKEGATLAEIAKATDWQTHGIRGFVSGHHQENGTQG